MTVTTVHETSTANKLAIIGGTPVRSAALPVWPLLPSKEALHELDLLLNGRLGPVNARADSMAQKRMFEENFAAWCQTRFAVAVSTGTAALDLAVDALHLEPGGVVVAANYGHPSTIRQAAKNHELLLLDVDPETLCLSPAELDNAHGAITAARRSGSIGDIGAFSLHATKNLSCGEGGILTCSREELFRQVWRDHDIGRDQGSNPYDFGALGGNYRMPEMNALLARHRLVELDQENRTRMANMARLRSLVPVNSPLEFLPVGADVEIHGYHLVAARYRPQFCHNLSRGRFVLALCAEGIPCNTGWPALLSNIPAVKPFVKRTSTPVAERALSESVWLDQRLLLEEDGVHQIAEAIAKIAQLGWTLRRGR
jgi:dTDP-4-amino-4,6-dideoxygalactose transaminase